MSNRIRLKAYREDLVEFEEKRNMVCSRLLLEALAEHHADADFVLPEDPLDPELPPAEPPRPDVVVITAPIPLPSPLPPIPNSEMAADAAIAFPIGRIEAIQRAVLTEFPRLRLADLKAQRRTAVIVRARQIAMYLAKDLTGLSLPEVGRKFGGRDHTTVLHAFRKIRWLVENDVAVAEQIQRIKEALPEGFCEE